MKKKKAAKASRVHAPKVKKGLRIGPFILPFMALVGILFVAKAMAYSSEPKVLGMQYFLAERGGGDNPAHDNRNNPPPKVNEDHGRDLDVHGKSPEKQDLEPENDLENEPENQTSPPVLQRLQPHLKDKLKIASEDGDKFVVHEGTVSAKSHFPLSIDLATNTLIVNTPAGTKAVTVLPQQAVDNMLRVGHVGTFNSGASSSAEASPAGTAVTSISLTEKDGSLVYTIDGESDKKLLGVVPVKVKKQVDVSAQTGEVISEHKSFLNLLLDFLSF